MVTAKDYEGPETAWCPGCGNFGILRAIKLALVSLGLEPHQVAFVSGIGQSSKLPHYLKCNCFNSIHGRLLPVATALKMANPSLHVIGVGGDGDGYSEGGNHFLHALRRNIDITYLVHDNQVYGLTKGQPSPTSEHGFKSGMSPGGYVLEPLRILEIAIAAGATYVARGFAAETEHLAGLIADGIKHKGFAFIDILQPCVVFNRINTYKWYKDRVHKLEGHDPTNRRAALELAEQWGEKIPIGLIYRGDRAEYCELRGIRPDNSPVRLDPKPADIQPLLEEMAAE